MEEVIDQLKEDKYVDDVRYAKKILRARSGPKAEGTSKLAMRLENEGVSPEVISEVLDSDEFRDENTIQEVIESRFPISSFSSDRKESQRELAKAIRYLESRGYPTSLALSAFRKLLDDVQ